MFSSKKKASKAIQKKHQATSLFGSGSTFTGAVEAANDLRIDGKVIGSVYGKSKVVMGESSLVEGPVDGINVEIRGNVKGNVHVSDTLTLKSTAVIEGNLFVDKLIMEEGATVNGRCKVGLPKEFKLGATNVELHKNTTAKEIAAVG